MNPKRLLALALVVAALAALPLAAAPRGHGDAAPAAAAGAADANVHHNPRALAAFLNLTPEQVEAARALREDLRAELEPLRETGRALREALRAALEAENPDPATVGAAAIALQEHRGQIRAELEEFEAAFKALLSSEQLERYEILREALRAFRHRGPGGPGGDDEPGS